MSDDDRSDEEEDELEDADDEPAPKKRTPHKAGKPRPALPHGKSGPTGFAKQVLMAEWAVKERRANPTAKYSTIRDKVRERFKVSPVTADRAITLANETLRQDFMRFAADAPRIIFDAYIDIHAEALREKNWSAARRALDSVRDMFGLKSALNIHIGGVGGGPTANAYAELSDAQLDALAALDGPGMPVIDVTSVSDAIELAETAIEVLEVEETEAI